MKIICAPDSFKQTITAADAARAMATGAARADPRVTCDELPVGDGGEGTMHVLIGAMGGSLQSAVVTGPLGEPIDAHFGISGDGVTGVIELAQASGLALVPPDRRDPARTTTFGTGELIRRAIERGCDAIIVCIGGSATLDGGAGIAQALGARFLDVDGNLIERPMTGGVLARVSRVDRTSMILPKSMRVACDVTNPLCGPEGAAAMYGPQKGATPRQVHELDAALARFAKVVGGDPDFSGAGAAGGAGFGLMNLCGARIERGIELVLDAVGFDDRCRGADLVLTGEGRLDAQSLHGKACIGVAHRAASLGAPTIAIVGSTGLGAEDCTDPKAGGPLQGFISLSDRFGPDRALREPASLIESVACDIMRQVLAT